MSWRRDFDAARDPYTARNALGITSLGGGGGAPTTAEYITASIDPTLTNERVLTNTASITWDFSTPGQAKASTAAGGGNVSNSGSPTSGQYAKWVTATTIQGVAPATVLSDIGAQPAGSYLTGNQNITLSGDASGSGATAITTTLATVNSNVGTFQGITVNAKGLVTAATNQSYLTGNQTITLSGDVTGSGTTAITTAIAANAVTNADLADMVTARLKGRVTASTGDPEDLTGTQATTLLDVFTSTLKGLAPSSGGGTANYLRADGTWNVPPSGAPSTAQYIVAATDATLSAERVGTSSTSITWDFGTAGQALVKRAALTGDVTAAADSNATLIANNAVTYAKLQDVTATARIIGRKTAAAGDPEECTLSEIMDFVGSAAQGDILYRGASTWTRLGAGTSGQFLKTQGTSANPIWATLAGGGNVSSAGTPTNGQWAQWTSSTTIQGVATASTPWVQKAGDTMTGRLTVAASAVDSDSIVLSGAAHVGVNLRPSTGATTTGWIYQAADNIQISSDTIIPFSVNLTNGDLQLGANCYVTGNLVSKGVTDGSNAAAGKVGEFLSASFSNVAFTGTVTNLTTLALTAGDWDVWCVFTAITNSEASNGYAIVGVSATSATLDNTLGRQAWQSVLASNFPASAHVQSRFSSASAFNVYAIGQCAGVTTMTATLGFLMARRRR
jgi:Repeat of unknown function (DUF5907)